ncbi:dihydrofolate reductase [bacterium]|jgi:dihydrofolate reductase|nr:dihydrofolate reductase [bacterium]MBT4121360.1 dihydrofolate reductase [bacterium]MBT4335510.1 dihydrofolate reductase [bacterium]MBT4495615.1 dihydrofolate reductase [bacterium]MBT4764344.1 dihydrofolate reductase [bacterium]
MNFSIIVAIDKKRGIGINNDLPWHIKKDLKHFSETTISKSDKLNAVIMGRKTWDSLPQNFRPLKNRLNVVLSRQDNLSLPEGVLHFKSLDEALNNLNDSNEIFIIGGGSLYHEAIKHSGCNKLYITHVDIDKNCDTFFPEIPEKFKKTSESEVQTEDDWKFVFTEYER